MNRSSKNITIISSLDEYRYDVTRITINGERHWMSECIEVEDGTVIMMIDHGMVDPGNYEYLYINGELIDSQPFNGIKPIEYVYTITKDCTISIDTGYMSIVES